MDTKHLTIIIPALNEEEAIEKTIQSVPRQRLSSMGYHTQVLVVDNGSTDRTGELAKKAGADVVFEPRKGYGYAYKAGFMASRGEIIATSDADATYPVEDIPRLLSILEKDNLDFITTNRYGYMENGAMRNMHKVGNAILNGTNRLLFQVDLRDSQSGMWVFKKDLLGRMVLKANTMALSEELKIEACYYLKCQWKELPIQYRARVGRVKLKSWQDGIGNLTFLVRKRINRGV